MQTIKGWFAGTTLLAGISRQLCKGNKELQHASRPSDQPLRHSDELPLASAEELVELYRSKAAAPVEVIAAVLARVGRLKLPGVSAGGTASCLEHLIDSSATATGSSRPNGPRHVQFLVAVDQALVPV